MQLLWQNGIPMCIEVLLCPDCPCGSQKATSPEVSTIPSSTDLLLEQWTITMVNKRWPDGASMSMRGLFQAVRSQLHFSQLSAWWSRNNGTKPANVYYRVTVPEEAFSTQFRLTPQEHSFPIAPVGRNSGIKVSVRTLPRMEEVPVISCAVHHAGVMLTRGLCMDGGSGTPIIGEDKIKSEELEEGSTKAMQGNSDHLLGESLLDPPQSLDLFTRRYQSPSRCASPSMETPEHLMFGRIAAKQEGMSRWRTNSPPSPPNNGPQRRLGRQGLARRRDSQKLEDDSSTSGLLDDRLQNPCTRSGKHHCRCAIDEEFEMLQPIGPHQQKRSRTIYPRAETSIPQSSKKPLRNPASKMKLDESFNKFEECLNPSNVQKKSEPSSIMLEEPNCSKQSKKLKECMKNDGAEKASCSKLDLELSPTEFEEVLAVLRYRNDPSKPFTQGSSKDVSVPPHILKSSTQKPVEQTEKCEAHTVSLANFNATTLTTSPTSHKADLLMEAILRNSVSKTKTHLSNSVTVKQENLSSVFIELSDKQCHNVEKSKLPLSLLNSKAMPCLDPVNENKNSSHSKYFGSNWIQGGNSSNQGVCDSSLGDRTESTILKVDNNVIDQIKCKLKSNNTACSAKRALFSENSSLSSEYVITDGIATTNSKKCVSEPKVPLAFENSRTSSTEANKIQEHCDHDKTILAIENMVIDDSDLDSYKFSQDNEVNINERTVPSALDKAKFRRSLDSAASMVFHSRTGLPLTSSPAPVRRGKNCFDFDSSLNSVSAIRNALFESGQSPPVDDVLSISSDDTESESGARSPCSPGVGPTFPTTGRSPGLIQALSANTSLLGSFEESVLNGRLEPVSTVQGFTADLGASGSFCPRHVVLPVTVFFYTLGDNDKVSTPYLGHINLGKKGYNVPRTGTIQVTLFNPLGTVVKMFVIMYDLADMPPNSQTFLRQRTLYMPAGGEEQLDDSQKWLRYLIHLKFGSSKSGRIYLHTDIRMIIFRKSDLDTATAHGLDMAYELRSYTQGPTDPKFSPRK